MSGRFLDKKEIIEQEKDFVEREHGIPLKRHVIAYIAASLAFISISLFLPASNLFIHVVIGTSIFACLGVMTYFFIKKDREVIHGMELQNALFAGAAKLATEFCIILKYDGTVIYVDPDYNRKFFHLKNQGLSNGIDALCQTGGLAPEDKEKLEQALAQGRTETVTFHLDEPVRGETNVALTLEPIGIYAQKDKKHTMNLAVKRITRPSGYFFLHASSENDVNEGYDYLNHYSVGFYHITPDGVFEVVNKTLGASLGIQTSVLKKRTYNIKEFFVKKEAADAFLATESDWEGEVILKDAHHKPIKFYIVKEALYEEEALVGMRGIAVSLTNLTHAPLLPSTSAHTGTTEYDLLQHSPIATAIIDTDYQLIESNPMFNHLAGLDNHDGDFYILFNADDRPKIKELIEHALSGGDCTEETLDIELVDREDTMVTLYVSCLFNDNGSVSGVLCHLIDTTEFKHLEQRFAHSQKMQAVGQLAGGIAHDFNNLLTAMIGFCDLLLMRHPAGDQSFADIMQIKQNANRAANLVRQLLAFSRKQTLQPEIINVSDVFADLSNLISRLIGENIELNVIHTRDLWNVRVDQGQLEQVIINLAVNARDAMAEGGSLLIKTHNATISDSKPMDPSFIPPTEDEVISHGDYVLIEMTDTGCGIDKKLMSKIFDPFFSTKEVGSGTGLGLSTVYGIIKQTDGYVYVKSEPGKGTTFAIYFKRHKGEDKPLEKQPEVEKESTDLTGSGTVLLVEDEAPVRVVSMSALSNKGYNVLEADCGERGLDIIKERGDEIDIIITDVVMPGMQGTTMIEEASKLYPNLKVIFISGYAEDAFLNSFGDEREFNFLPKPYSLKQLATKVKDVLSDS